MPISGSDIFALSSLQILFTWNPSLPIISHLRLLFEPDDETRVVLKEPFDEESNDYINASYITVSRNRLFGLCILMICLLSTVRMHIDVMFDLIKGYIIYTVYLHFY